MTIQLNFFAGITIVFVVLKLCAVISWSWWWVLSPLWIGAIITISLVVVALVIGRYAQR